MGAIREAFQGEHSRGKWLVSLLVFAIALIVTALIFIALSVSSLGDSVKKIEALRYPVPQSVSNRLVNVDYTGPALRLGDYVHVTGTKCLDAPDAIITFGVTTQSLVDPGGVNSPGAIAANLRTPGCVTKSYSNALDPSIVARIVDLFKTSHVPFVVMKITGFESPVDQHYASAEWYTEDFRVYPPLHPLPPCCNVSSSASATIKETP